MARTTHTANGRTSRAASAGSGDTMSRTTRNTRRPTTPDHGVVVRTGRGNMSRIIDVAIPARFIPADESHDWTVPRDRVFRPTTVTMPVDGSDTPIPVACAIVGMMADATDAVFGGHAPRVGDIVTPARVAEIVRAATATATAFTHPIDGDKPNPWRVWSHHAGDAGIPRADGRNADMQRDPETGLRADGNEWDGGRAYARGACRA